VDEFRRTDFWIRVAPRTWWAGILIFVARLFVANRAPDILWPAALLTFAVNITAAVAMYRASPVSEERFPFAIPGRHGMWDGALVPILLAGFSFLLLLVALSALTS
jgi:hypothetical protein